MPARRHLPVLALIGLLAACSSGDDDASSTTPSTTSAVGTTPTTSSDPPTTPPATTESTAPTTPPTTPATTAAAPPPTTPPDWQPLDGGPYDVGVATITVDDPAGDRPLTVDVWFPLDPDAGDLPPHQYTLLPGVFYPSPGAFTATAELVATDAVHPLVVYSHGSGGLRYIHSSYTEALASHGYLVAAPDHTGNTAVDRLAGNESPRDLTAFLRPTDVRRVIDAFTDPTHPAAGAWAARVDADRVAVTGHSFGGFTAIAAVTGFSNARGTVPADGRVDAIVPIAPATGPTLLTDDVLAQVDVPMLVLVGTDDVTTPVDPNVTRLWDLTDNTPAYRVELVAGEHQTFTDLCAYTRFLPTLPEVPEVVVETIDAFAAEGCSEGDIDDRRAAELTNTYAVQFLDQVFRDGPGLVATPPGDVVFRSR